MRATFGPRATGHRRYHLDAELSRHTQRDDVGGDVKSQVDVAWRDIKNARTEILGGTNACLWCEHEGRNGVPRTTSCYQQQREHGEGRPLHSAPASGASLSYP